MILPETPVNLSEEPQVAVPDVKDDRSAHNSSLAPEIGGREGPEPTRFGDWEKNGRCIDF
jgi:hypothetical protein